jgi:hypothetical protein
LSVGSNVRDSSAAIAAWTNLRNDRRDRRIDCVLNGT